MARQEVIRRLVMLPHPRDVFGVRGLNPPPTDERALCNATRRARGDWKKKAPIRLAALSAWVPRAGSRTSMNEPALAASAASAPSHGATSRSAYTPPYTNMQSSFNASARSTACSYAS